MSNSVKIKLHFLAYQKSAKALKPIKYLGLPLSSIYPKAKYFAALIDNTRAKADSWMLKLLSFSGRIELIKSVLQNLLTYLAFYAKFLRSGKMQSWS